MLQYQPHSSQEGVFRNFPVSPPYALLSAELILQLKADISKVVLQLRRMGFVSQEFGVK